MQILFCIVQEMNAIFRSDVQRMNGVFLFCISTCRIRNWTLIFPLSGNPKECAFLLKKAAFLPCLTARFPPRCPMHFRNFFRRFPLFGISKKRNFFRQIGTASRCPLSTPPFSRPPSQASASPSSIFPQTHPTRIPSFSTPKRRKRGDRIVLMRPHTTDTPFAYNPLHNHGSRMIFTLDSTPACQKSCPPQ